MLRIRQVDICIWFKVVFLDLQSWIGKKRQLARQDAIFIITSSKVQLSKMKVKDDIDLVLSNFEEKEKNIINILNATKGQPLIKSQMLLIIQRTSKTVKLFVKMLLA